MIDSNNATAFEISDVTDISRISEEIAACADLNLACEAIEGFLKAYDIDLMSVIFAEVAGGNAALRPFRRVSEPLKELSILRREAGGCPILVEARRLMHPYDAVQLDRKRYSDFIGQRFIDELGKQGHESIAAIPVVIGDGMAVFTAGLRQKQFSGELKLFLTNLVCQLVISIIGTFPEVTKMFRPKVLTMIEAEALLLKTNGNPDSVVSASLGVSGFTVRLILSSAIKKLDAHNLHHAISKALEMGEIMNMHVGKHDFV